MDKVGNEVYKKTYPIKIGLMCKLRKYAVLISYNSALRGDFILSERESS